MMALLVSQALPKSQRRALYVKMAGRGLHRTNLDRAVSESLTIHSEGWGDFSEPASPGHEEAEVKKGSSRERTTPGIIAEHADAINRPLTRIWSTAAIWREDRVAGRVLLKA